MRYLCRRAVHSPVIDGRLDKPFWASAEWTADFVDILGDAGPRPRLRTRAKLLWDDEYLYVGADMEEPDVWATLTERDAIVFHDNDFEVFLDPDDDRQDYLEIEVNALGTIFDLRLERPYRDGGPAHHDWDCDGLLVAVHVAGTLNDPRDSDEGWSVELAIPFAAVAPYSRVPCPPRPGDAWRLNFSRVQWSTVIEDGCTRKLPDTPEDNWVWTPMGLVDMHLPERWGWLDFA
jgi:hypothetical protein